MTTIRNTTIKKWNKLESSNLLRAKLFYPQIAVFEDLSSFRLIYLNGKHEGNCDEGKIYKFNDEITDIALQDHLLWTVLQSNLIVVTDLLNGLQIKIHINNYLHLKFHAISSNSFLFLTDSGEYLKLPYSSQELSEHIKGGLNELTVSLKKVNSEQIKKAGVLRIDRLEYYIDEGKLICECPITGQQEIISSQILVNFALAWKEFILLADGTNMWLVDMKSCEIVLQFKNTATNFVPVLVHNNIFYYLACSNQEVWICEAKICTTGIENDTDQDLSRNHSEATSSQEILISELNSAIDEIMASGKVIPITTKLQTLFDQVDSLDLLIDLAIKLYLCNSIYKPILYSLQKRVYLKNDECQIFNITDILIKLDLKEYIIFRNISSYDDLNLLKMNCVNLCITFISKMDFDIASICWLKYSELKLSLSSEDVTEILNSTPTNTKMSAILIWFKNFVPSLLEQNPFYIDLFVRWAMERIFILEQSNYWPKIGIKFIEEITTVLESSLKTICLRPISIDDLDILKDRLQYILELKEKYKINILLSELSSQSPREVALIMLRRCYTEDLERFLQEYLPTYATRHLLDMDDILRNFVENETASSGGTVDGICLEIILKAFRSLGSKLECLLNVLKVLDVPWNATVLQLAINAAASATKDYTMSDSDHVLAQEIQKELCYANAKVVLKKYNFPLIYTDYNLVLQKIVMSPVVDLNDLKAVTAVMPSYTNYGNVLYVNKCLENCDAKAALDYFHNLSHKQKTILLKTVMVKYEQIIHGSDNKSIERNYIDFMRGTHMLNHVQLNNIDNLYNLKNSFNIKLDLNNIYQENICTQKYNDWQQKENGASCGRGDSMTRLIPMNETKSSSLLTLLRGVSASHQVRNYVENLITSSLGQDNLSEEISSVLMQLNDVQNVVLLIETYNVLTELINKCDEEYLHELLRHLSVLNALIHSNVTVKNSTIGWKFNYIFLPISSGIEINDFINFLFKDGLIALKNETEENDVPRIQSKCEFMPFRIISNIVANMENRKSLAENLTQYKNKVTKRLLARVVSAQDFDAILTTNLLVMLKNTDREDDDFCLFEHLKGQNESLSLELTGYILSPGIRQTFGFDNNIQVGSVAHPPQFIIKSKFNINLAEIALPENNEETWDAKVILFYILKQYPDTTSERLVELCTALNLSLNDGLSLQLISLLITWDLKYKLFRDEFGRRQIYIENDTSILERCTVIWDNVSNKDFLKDVLNDFWKNGEVTLHGRVVSVNSYYYEVFLCIYRLLFGSTMDSSSVKEYYLLNFLKDYKRVSAPKQYEFERFSEKGMFPEIGNYRLPFHLFMREDMWSNLKSEITLETYERWLPVASLLTLDKDLQIAKDMICSNALKQTMTTRARDDVSDKDAQEKEPWRLTSREEPLLRAAHRCVSHIANMEWAGACLFYVLQGCTRGADQVAAAHLCYQFAQRWASVQPGNRAVKQMERLHSTLSTHHALYKIEWACEELIRLSTEPTQLLRTLYLHPDFVNKIARHDINRAANEIADKNNIDIRSIRFQILENLLEKSLKNDKRLALNTKELITAKYIFRATCPKMGAIYLSRIAFDDDSDYKQSKKMRALQCLMSVVEPENCIKVTKREREDLWISLLELLSIVKLENINMPWVVGIFMQDKCRALEQLVQTVDGNVDGLRITADLACKFGNCQIIRKLVPLLRNAGLYEDLMPLLLKLSAAPDPVTFTAWRAVILSPFHQADYPITERQKVKCLNAINLLPICPIIKDEDLKEIWKNCARLKCVGLGCLVLPYMTPQARQSLAELKNIDRRSLIANLKNLYADTYLVSGAMQVIESMASRVYR